MLCDLIASQVLHGECNRSRKIQNCQNLKACSVSCFSFWQERVLGPQSLNPTAGKPCGFLDFCVTFSHVQHLQIHRVDCGSSSVYRKKAPYVFAGPHSSQAFGVLQFWAFGFGGFRIMVSGFRCGIYGLGLTLREHPHGGTGNRSSAENAKA